MKLPLKNPMAAQDSGWHSCPRSARLPLQFESVMEKTVIKRTLREFRDRENPWKDRTYQERLRAMAVICGTQQAHGRAESGFSRLYRITRSPAG